MRTIQLKPSRFLAGARDLFAPGGNAAPPAPAISGYVLAAIVLGFTATAWYAASIDLGFSADGAYTFVYLLDNRAFLNPAWSRLHGDLILQWPMVLAMTAGVTHLPTLDAIFHLGLYLPFLISFLICCYAARGLNDSALLLFPLVSYVLVSLPAASIFVGTSHVLAVIVWPILFLLLRPRLTALDSALLLALLFLMSRTYESTAVVALILLCLLGLRIAIDSQRMRPVLMVGALITLIALIIAVYWALFPASTENRSNFTEGLFRLPRRHPMLVLSIGSMILLACSWLIPRLRAIGLLAVLTAAGSIAVSASGRVASADVSFNMRTLTLTLLPLLLIGALGFHFLRPRLNAGQWVITGVVFLCLTAGYAQSWAEWRNFRHLTSEFLATHEGYVALDDTPIAHHRQRWTWTVPLLSTLWSDDCVRTIILNRPDTKWEPFDPRRDLPLQRYISYSPAFAAAAPRAKQCTDRSSLRSIEYPR